MYELRIAPCSPEEAETLSEQLENLGAVSVSMMDFEDVPILEPGVGETPLWDKLIVHAIFTDETEANEAKKFVQENHAHIHQTLETLPEQNWERVCLERFQPLQFGHRLWICPSWLTPPHPDAVNLILDPGLAFGTGTHATTALCLTWLDQHDLNDKTVVDYGCGSGILALASLKLGAKHVYAVDIDDQALLATAQNREMNALPEAMLTITHPEELDVSVDIIIANILLTPLLSLKSSFKALLKPHGKLVVSGLFASQTQALIDAYSDSFEMLETQTLDEWALICFSAR